MTETLWEIWMEKKQNISQIYHKQGKGEGISINT